MRTLALIDDQVLRNSEALETVHTSAEIEDMENVSLSENAVTLPVPSVMVHVGVMKGDCLFMTAGLSFGGLDPEVVRQRTAGFLWEKGSSINVDTWVRAFPLVGDYRRGLTSREYTQIISSPGVAGGALELIAISEVFKAPITIDMGDESVICLNPCNGGTTEELLLKYTNFSGGPCGHFNVVNSISLGVKKRIDMNWSNVRDLGLGIRGGGYDSTNELTWNFIHGMPWRLFFAPPEEARNKTDPCKWVAEVCLLVVLACKKSGMGPSLSDFFTAFCDDGTLDLKALLGWKGLNQKLVSPSTIAEKFKEEPCYKVVLSRVNASRTERGLTCLEMLSSKNVKKVYNRVHYHVMQKLKQLLVSKSTLTDEQLRDMCFASRLPPPMILSKRDSFLEGKKPREISDNLETEKSSQLKRMKHDGGKDAVHGGLDTRPPSFLGENLSADSCQKKDASNFLYAVVQYFSQSFGGMLITRDVLNIIMTCKQEKMFHLNGGICHVEDSVIINSKKVTNEYIWRLINQRKTQLVTLNVNGCIRFRSFWSGEDFLLDGNDDWRRGITLSKLQVMEVVGTSAMSIRFLVERCNCLTRLNISSTQIKILKGIEVLSQLRTLFMSNLQVVDITPVGELEGLMTLVAENCTGLYNLDPITKLTTLKTLDIKGSSSARNFRKIAGQLVLLKSLRLGFAALTSTTVEDLIPGNLLSALRTLYVEALGENNITNIDSIGNCSCLEELALINFPGVTNIQVLTRLHKLKVLRMRRIGVEDIEPLNACTQLDVVELTQCLRKVDFNRFDKPQPGTRSLDLEGSTIYTIAVLDSYFSLTYLNITKTEVHNLNGIEACKSLRSLVAGKNPIRSITPLSKCLNLRDLDIRCCELLRGAGIIGELESLERLDVSGLLGPNTLNVRRLVKLKSLCAIRSKIVVHNLHCCSQLRHIAVVGTINQNLRQFLVGYSTDDKAWKLSCLTIGAPGLFDVAFVVKCDAYSAVRKLTITESPMDTLEAVVKLVHLRMITLDCTLVTDVDVLQKCPNLETIVVRSSVLCAPKTLHKSSTLLEVDLSGTNVKRMDCPDLVLSESIVFKAGTQERISEEEDERGRAGMRGAKNVTSIRRTCESFQGIASAHLAVYKEPSVP